MGLLGGKFFREPEITLCPSHMQKANLLSNCPLYRRLPWYSSRPCPLHKNLWSDTSRHVSRKKSGIYQLSRPKRWKKEEIKKKKHLELGLCRSKADNSSWETICFAYLSSVRPRRKKKPNGTWDSGKHLKHAIFLGNICEKYRKHLFKNLHTSNRMPCQSSFNLDMF